MITEEKAIEILDELISQVKQINNRDTTGFNDWKTATLLTLKRMFPTNENLHLEFEKLNAFFHFLGDTSNVESVKKTAVTLLEVEKKNIIQFGFVPAKQHPTKNSGGVHVNVNQTNTQTQQIEIELKFIIETLKEELRKAEFEELKAIIESNQTPEEKKESVLSKLKSFGSDVLSNIVAGIITNPQLWQ